MTPDPSEARQRSRVLVLSTVAFTLLFAVWLMLGMLSIKIKPELGLTDGQLYNLTIAAILAGSLLRFHFGRIRQFLKLDACRAYRDQGRFLCLHYLLSKP